MVNPVNHELQRAQDMMTAMQSQRDQALNSLVVAQAELAGLRRDVETLRSQLVAKAEKTAIRNLELD